MITSQLQNEWDKSLQFWWKELYYQDETVWLKQKPIVRKKMRERKQGEQKREKTAAVSEYVGQDNKGFVSIISIFVNQGQTTFQTNFIFLFCQVKHIN